MHFYTSINNNYLPKARILAKSVKRFCKDAKFSLILSDEIPAGVNPENEPFDEILKVEDLNIPVENLKLWIYMHTVVEVCTAVKGQALVKFLESGSEKVVYLDPDIAVFNDLHELEALLDEHDVILTPHQTIPETNNIDIENNEICSLKHGTYNFGFYAVKNSENGLKFARWWRDRLIEFCYDDIPNGIFTDQKWGDLAPAMFDGVHVSRDPGYNVSTWNLTNRKVTKENDTYLVNGVPLKFYHFSGFDSGAQEVMLNLYAKNNPVLFELREWYIKRQDEEEQEKYGSLPSIYNFYDNGEKITKEERVVLRKRKDVYNFFKDTNPHVVEQEKSYYKWYKIEVLDRPEIDVFTGELYPEKKRIIELENEIENQAIDSNAKIAILKEEIKRYEHELQCIYNSRSWELAMKIKKVRNYFRVKK